MKIYKLLSVFLSMILLISIVGRRDEIAAQSDSHPSALPMQTTGTLITPANVDQVTQLAMLGRGLLKAVALSPDNRLLAIAADHGVWLLDVQSGTEHMIADHQTDTLTFSPDSTFIVEADDHQIMVWNTASRELVQSFQPDATNIEEMSVSPDGSHLFAYHDSTQMGGSVSVWAVEDGESLLTVDDVTAWALTSDAETLLIGAADGGIRAIEVSTGDPLQSFEGHGGEVISLDVSPDDLALLSGGKDDTIRSWDIRTGEEIRQFEADELNFNAISFSPDGSKVLSTHRTRRSYTHVWNASTGELIGTYDIVAQFMPNSQALYGSEFRHHPVIIDIDSGDVLEELQGDFMSVIVSSDGKTAYSTSQFYGEVYRQDVGTGASDTLADGFLFANAIFAPNGHQLLRWWLETPERRLTLWDIGSQTVERQFTGEEQIGGSLGTGFVIDFSSDGRLLAATGYDHIVRIWDVETGELMHELSPEFLDPLGFLVFSPDDEWLAIISEPRSVVWEVETGTIVREYDPSDGDAVHVAMLDRGGSIQVMFLNDNQLEVWTPNATSALHFDFKGDLNDFFNYSHATTYVTAPDGHTTVFHAVELNESGDVSVEGWQVVDADSGETLQTFAIEENIYPYDVSFSYDSHYLLMKDISLDRVVVVDVTTGEVMQRIDIDDLTDAAWSPANYLMVIVSDEQVWLYDGLTGQQLRSIDMPFGYGRQVQFSPTGDSFITTGDEFLYVNRGAVHIFGIPEE